MIWKLVRLGRSLRYLIDNSETLKERGVALRSLTKGFDTAASAARMLYHVLGAIAQFERDIIQERTLLGIEQARRDGVPFGPKPKLIPSAIVKAPKMIEGGDSPASVAQAFRVDRTTLWCALTKAGLQIRRPEGDRSPVSGGRSPVVQRLSLCRHKVSLQA